eukprot:scaffold244508_cov24-Tisochrysis_lutea.AAC.2
MSWTRYEGLALNIQPRAAHAHQKPARKLTTRIYPSKLTHPASRAGAEGTFAADQHSAWTAAALGATASSP